MPIAGVIDIVANDFPKAYRSVMMQMLNAAGLNETRWLGIVSQSVDLDNLLTNMR